MVVVVMDFGRGQLPTLVVLGSQVLRGLGNQEGTSWGCQGRWLIPVGSECWAWPQSLLTLHAKWCLWGEQGLGCSDLVKNWGSR